MQYTKMEMGTARMPAVLSEGTRRRNYDVCMVFKCKTSKAVRYGEDERDMMLSARHLAEPTENAKAQMQLWQSWREAAMKSLIGCGLHLFSYYSRDRDTIVVKIGAGAQKLRDTAARLRYKLQLKEQFLGAYAEYRHDFPGRPENHFRDRRVVSHIYQTYGEDDFPDSDAIFRPLDKIHLINHIITSTDKDCAGVPVGQMLHEGDLMGYFPLHEAHALKELEADSMRWIWIDEDFAQKLRDYFGEKIAYYFL